jgi:CHAT domain-containing protein
VISLVKQPAIGLWEVFTLALGNPTTDLPALAFAESEVQAISALYASHDTLLGPDASEAAFRAVALSADWIHLAIHGDFNPISPLFSTLHLAREFRIASTSGADGMAAFHRHLQEGMGPAAALRAAREEVRANDRWAAPYYWAGVQIIGNGEGRTEPEMGAGVRRGG